MLSAVVIANAPLLNLTETDRVRAVVKTLAALVPLVVADLIADAAIVTLPAAGIAGLEDSAGCRVFARDDLIGALGEALRAARRDYILLLHPGFGPDAAFMGEVEQIMEQGAGMPMALLSTPETFAQRLFAGLAPTVGIVSPRALLEKKAHDGNLSLSALRRSLSASPMRSRAVRL